MPIFFIGVPRSGTTITFATFARHERLGGPRVYPRPFPDWAFSGLLLPFAEHPLMEKLGPDPTRGFGYWRERLKPKPDEAYPFWERNTRVPFARNYLRGVFPAPAARNRLRAACRALLFWQRRDRFAAKLTGPGRIHYLRAIFPDAVFVHVIRDPRAVVHSLLRVPFWNAGGGGREPWWKGGFPSAERRRWERNGRDPAELAALQWRFIIESIREEAEPLTPDEYHEVRYETFAEAPRETLRRLYAQTGLPDSPRSHRALERGRPIRNMNHKFRDGLPPRTRRRIVDAAMPLMEELGYLSEAEP
jgi:hypothetical protein